MCNEMALKNNKKLLGIINRLNAILDELEKMFIQNDSDSNEVPEYITSVVVNGKTIPLQEPIKIYYDNVLSGLHDQEGNPIDFHIAKNVGFNIMTIPHETKREAFEDAQKHANHMAKTYSFENPEQKVESSKAIIKLWSSVWDQAIGKN